MYSNLHAHYIIHCKNWSMIFIPNCHWPKLNLVWFRWQFGMKIILQFLQCGVDILAKLCMYVYLHECVCVYTSMCVREHVCTRACVYASMCVCVCACMDVCICGCMHVHVYILVLHGQYTSIIITLRYWIHTSYIIKNTIIPVFLLITLFCGLEVAMKL